MGQWQQTEKHEEYNAVITVYVFVGVSDWYLSFHFLSLKRSLRKHNPRMEESNMQEVSRKNLKEDDGQTEEIMREMASHISIRKIQAYVTSKSS